MPTDELSMEEKFRLILLNNQQNPNLLSANYPEQHISFQGTQVVNPVSAPTEISPARNDVQ